MWYIAGKVPPFIAFGGRPAHGNRLESLCYELHSRLKRRDLSL